MDDILTYSKRKDHVGHLIDLFKAIIRNGLKISPTKCKLFKKALVFMGITIMIEDGMSKMQPLKSRAEAILKEMPPKSVKECRSFCEKRYHCIGVMSNRKLLMKSSMM